MMIPLCKHCGKPRSKHYYARLIDAKDPSKGWVGYFCEPSADSTELSFGDQSMPPPKKIRVYLAGPMTGLPDLNFPAFHSAAAKLRAQGFIVINPAEIDPDPGKHWSDYMRQDIPELVKCDWIALLPGWESSKGARLEHHIATTLGMPVLAIPESFTHN